MPRIYKPFKPSENKGANPVTETKAPEKKPETPPKSGEKKDGGQ